MNSFSLIRSLSTLL